MSEVASAAPVTRPMIRADAPSDPSSGPYSAFPPSATMSANRLTRPSPATICHGLIRAVGAEFLDGTASG